MVKVLPRLWFWYNSIAWRRTSHFGLCVLVIVLISIVAPCANGITWSTKNYVKLTDGNLVPKDAIEHSLLTVHDIATENLGSLCVSKSYRPLEIPINPERFENPREKLELAALIIQDVGINRHGGLLDSLAKGILSDDHVIGARILALNASSGVLGSSVWWAKNEKANSNMRLGEPIRIEEEGLQVGKKPSINYPWFEDEISSPGLRSPKFAPSPPNISFKGWWTYPYYSCTQKKWILSYSIAVPAVGRHILRGFLSIDIDITKLKVNQCDYPTTITSEAYEMLRFPKSETVTDTSHEIEAFRGSHKCHRNTMTCEYRLDVAKWSLATTVRSIMNTNSWSRGAYKCFCKRGFYSVRHPKGFNGTIMEVAYHEMRDNISTYYYDVFQCYPCAPGCGHCLGPEPCLAEYNWPFRISLLIISICCAISTIMLAAYLFQHRKIKVFKVASPIFLLITLIGCAFMYLEMACIFPVLDTYFCIATKWTRHMGFCITYTSLLMKTWRFYTLLDIMFSTLMSFPSFSFHCFWITGCLATNNLLLALGRTAGRVSLTYRVKSAHKVKLTDKQLLQWTVPILLVMLIYLGTWTISATPYAENIRDSNGLKFKQCSYNWWDHSLAIGEVLFLAWGIRVCYNVRNAESLYNEARQISYAIYNIATVNITAAAFHLLIFPQAGPDIKYFLGFVRTQLSTTVTIALVFGPKVIRVLRGQGDQWDNKARVRSITASFSLNGVGLVPEDSPDLYQENEELKEEIQKLAHQIEFMKTVHMQMNNRHLKPKPGGYFTITSTSFQSPFSKSISAQTQTSNKPSQPNSCISDDGHSGSNSLGTNSIGYPATSIPNQQQNNGIERV